MQKRIPFLLALLACLLCKPSLESTGSVRAKWGFFGHKLINRLAIYTLPNPLFAFYKSHLGFMEEHAVDPDKRRYAVVGEAECHFIDLDQYGTNLDSIKTNLPENWKEASEKFSESALRQHGIGPWNTWFVYLKLQHAFEEKDLDRVLKYSAEIGHYIGDMHVPLHTTRNYNGQLSNQHGIHGLWESRLPELFSAKYKLFPSKATYLSDPKLDIWEIVYQSHSLLGAVYLAEDTLTKLDPNGKFGYENRGAAVQKVYSRSFSEKYQLAMGPMVQDRMLQAINFIGCIIYTAWVNAGQPDLSTLVSRKNTEVVPDSLSTEANPIKIRVHE